jgi:hypothetical protein
MKIRKVTKEEKENETLCQFILKRYKRIGNQPGVVDLCNHKAKWKAGRTFYCGWHVPNG